MYTYLKWGLYQCAGLAAIVFEHKARLLLLLLFIRIRFLLLFNIKSAIECGFQGCFSGFAYFLA